MKLNKSMNRRGFLKWSATAGGCALAASAIPLNLVAADEVPEDDAMAQSMGYVKDASTVDSAKYPRWADSQFCNNCALYAGDASAELAPCSIFQNRLVRGTGWCNAWVAKG